MGLIVGGTQRRGGVSVPSANPHHPPRPPGIPIYPHAGTTLCPPHSWHWGNNSHKRFGGGGCPPLCPYRNPGASTPLCRPHPYRRTVAALYEPPLHGCGAGVRWGAAPPTLAPSVRAGWGWLPDPPVRDPAPGQLFLNEIKANLAPPAALAAPGFHQSHGNPGGSSYRLKLPSRSVRGGFGIWGGCGLLGCRVGGDRGISANTGGIWVPSGGPQGL